MEDRGREACSERLVEGAFVVLGGEARTVELPRTLVALGAVVATRHAVIAYAG